jgi:23S rRNA G2445 N2-methylase RlmL
MRLNLQLQTGLRVLWKIADFKAADGQQLYNRAVEIPWESYIPADGYVSIGSSVRNDTIRNTKFAGLRLKDALVDAQTPGTIPIKPSFFYIGETRKLIYIWILQECR